MALLILHSPEEIYICAEHSSSSQYLDRENFLVPIDGRSLTDPSIAERTYISLDWLIKTIAERRPNNVPIIFIVDCCRIEVGKDGLACGDPIKTTVTQSNVYIMYATANGRVAMDGKECGNGAFTERLLKYMDSNMTVMEIASAIVSEFEKELRGEQVCAALLTLKQMNVAEANLFWPSDALDGLKPDM